MRVAHIENIFAKSAKKQE